MSNNTPSSSDNDKAKLGPQASISQLLSFADTKSIRLLYAAGSLFAAVNGLIYPALAYMFSTSFTSITEASQSDGMDAVNDIAIKFLLIGTVAMMAATFQTGFYELAAAKVTESFRRQWFYALLRQDQAYYDLYNISGQAASIGPNSNKIRRGLGRKAGEGIQFTITSIGGIAFAFYSSWKAALVTIAVLPLVAGSSLMTLKINQGVTQRRNKAYEDAGSVAYSTVSSIRTVVSLNAGPSMIQEYTRHTAQAFHASVKSLWYAGFINASLLGTFIMLYVALTVYGSYLIYDDIFNGGCDPSGASPLETCSTSASDVFGAMLGVAFAGQGLSQVGSFLENFAAARVAAYPAIAAISRNSQNSGPVQVPVASSSHHSSTIVNVEELDEENPSCDMTNQVKKDNTLTLSKYQIDSSSDKGLKPDNIQGQVAFKDVTFAYPTRPDDNICEGMNLSIEAGTTVALVGPSGGGKSTTISLIERFYDPNEGGVFLDGINLKDLNVKYLRSNLGLVSQEPVLFATSIGENIAYGKPGATQEDIEQAARMANAHDFIMTFPDGYSTQVGDKGAKLSGGQKQRIAIARVLISNPKVLLLDEATSALDSESEMVVQEALDGLLQSSNRTTIIIAHRLSTIRNADKIFYISGGSVVEAGTHDELMNSEKGLYKALVDKHEKSLSRMSTSVSTNNLSRVSSKGSLSMSREASLVNLADAGNASTAEMNKPQVEFKNVTFCYPTRPSVKVYNKFNLKVRKGETLALVGPSGGGKSTCVGLVERFYDPDEGKVYFDGCDIRDMDVCVLRSKIGLVGQEPVLFNKTIGENIAMGFDGATEDQIIEAAKKANAHNFIMEFKDGYNTMVGERGTQLSGGQKQRVAIARALVNNCKVLLLDEATSALDNESEHIVQQALDELMSCHERTTIVIAHRLSTIENADRIAYIADGVVKEIGTHEELMMKPNGRYARLVESQKRVSTLTGSNFIDDKAVKNIDEDNGNDTDNLDMKANNTKEVDKELEKTFNKRARNLARPDLKYIFVGSIGAIMAGFVFPCWGILFASMINLLFRYVDCTAESAPLLGFQDCEAYFDSVAEDMKQESYALGAVWAGLVLLCFVGNMLTFWGFGYASESLSKRLRDLSFTSLVRQEVAYFDKRSVGSITTHLQDDTSMIQAFSGEPIRTLLIQLASVLTGLIISFYYMWPFALVSIAVIPFMGFATAVEMKQMLGTDEGDSAGANNNPAASEINSPGGVIMETLLNIRTVASLTLEEARFDDYKKALRASEPRSKVVKSLMSGSTSGLSMLVQQYVNGLQFWWGGWLLANYPNTFDFNGFLVSMFALLFSLFGLGGATMGATDKDKAKLAAKRLFTLMDRESAIDALGSKAEVSGMK